MKKNQSQNERTGSLFGQNRVSDSHIGACIFERGNNLQDPRVISKNIKITLFLQKRNLYVFDQYLFETRPDCTLHWWGCDSQYYVRFLVRVSIFPDRIGSTGGLYPVWNGPVGSKIDADHEFCWRGKTVKAHPFTQTSLLS